MAFRAYQKMTIEPPFTFSVSVDRKMPNGIVLEETMSMEEAHELMPDPTLYDMDKAARSGVNLEQVSTKVIK